MAKSWDPVGIRWILSQLYPNRARSKVLPTQIELLAVCLFVDPNYPNHPNHPNYPNYPNYPNCPNYPNYPNSLGMFQTKAASMKLDFNKMVSGLSWEGSLL